MTRPDPNHDIAWALPPSDDELVFFTEEPVESDDHRDLAGLLIALFRWQLGPTSYVGGNQAVYFSETQVRNRDFLAPDVFAVVGDCDNAARPGWVVWKEGGRTPDLVVEILSPSTEDEDRGRKRNIYERLLHVSEYFLFDPRTNRLEGVRLQGDRYEEIPADAEGRLPSNLLDGYLGPLETSYMGRRRVWVRLFDGAGRLVPTAEERAEAEAERAEVEAKRAGDLAARLAAYEARFGALDQPEDS